MILEATDCVLDAWSGDAQDAPASVHPAADPGRMTPRVGVRAADPARRRALERALGIAGERDADVLVLDLPPGARSGEAAASFDGTVLVLSDDPDIAADEALAGVLPRTASPSQLRAAAAALAEGLRIRTAFAIEATDGARQGFAPPDAAPRPLLTPRELQILAHVGEGMSNKAIARRLVISSHTVKYHLEAVFAKLGVRSRAEAVSRGLRFGLLEV